MAQDKARIAFIGFGEVGQRFATDFQRTAGASLAAYDIKFHDGDTFPNRSRAAELGVLAALSPASAANGANCVISAVTADVAEHVAREAARYLAPGQIFFDINSASPATKARAAQHVEQAGAQYVEGAVMAAVANPGIRVPILAGGPMAESLAGLLNSLGMNLVPVAREFGRAAAIKLCRSIMIKGMEALMVDCARAAKAWKVEKEVYASLGETFTGVDWPALADNMGERVATHGVRRAAEMREAGEMVESLGADPELCLAIAHAQQRGAKTDR